MDAPLPDAFAAGKPKAAPLLEQMRAVLRFKRYNFRTEQTDLAWAKCFIVPYFQAGTHGMKDAFYHGLEC